MFTLDVVAWHIGPNLAAIVMALAGVDDLRLPLSMREAIYQQWYPDRPHWRRAVGLPGFVPPLDRLTDVGSRWMTWRHDGKVVFIAGWACSNWYTDTGIWVNYALGVLTYHGENGPSRRDGPAVIDMCTGHEEWWFDGVMIPVRHLDRLETGVPVQSQGDIWWWNDRGRAIIRLTRTGWVLRKGPGFPDIVRPRYRRPNGKLVPPGPAF